MRRNYYVAAFAVCAVVGISFGQGSDTLPMSDSVHTQVIYTDAGQQAYSGVELIDTSAISSPYTIPVGTSGELEIRDGLVPTPIPGFSSFTGDDPSDSSILGYFIFPYQFSDSVYNYNGVNYEYNGWSGFKLTWQDRGWTWDARGYDSLSIEYIGPLPQHKVDIFFGEQDPSGSNYYPSLLDSVGSLKANYVATYSSAAWKTVTIPIPPAPAHSNRSMLDEVRFLIHDTGSSTARPVSPASSALPRFP